MSLKVKSDGRNVGVIFFSLSPSKQFNSVFTSIAKLKSFVLIMVLETLLLSLPDLITVIVFYVGVSHSVCLVSSAAHSKCSCMAPHWHQRERPYQPEKQRIDFKILLHSLVPVYTSGFRLLFCLPPSQTHRPITTCFLLKSKND